MERIGQIISINGPIVKIPSSPDFQMGEMVYVGNENLVGEVIGLNKETITIQVYEETSGLKPHEVVTGTGAPISVTLAPGIISTIFDGIERPLTAIAEQSGNYINRGVTVESLDTSKLWDVTITVSLGQNVCAGTIIAEVKETSAVIHKSMIPPNISGTITQVASNGRYTITDPIVTIQDENGVSHTISLMQKWPIRTPRPVKNRYSAHRPLITGQRVIDTLFPLAKGGTAAVPSGFGTGKTMTQHQLAKWCDADIIIYMLDAVSAVMK